MLSKGFIRDEDGIWFTAEGLELIEVEMMEEEPGFYTRYFRIKASWKDESIITVGSNFESFEDAQESLDKMMGM